MQKATGLSLHDDLFSWMGVVGRSLRLFAEAMRPSSFSAFDLTFFLSKCSWMGVQSLPLVTISAVFVSLTLTLQSVVEMRALRTQDLSGAVIAIGLLRELGPLTVSLFWSARVSAHLCEEGRQFGLDRSDSEYAARFVLPSYIAGLLMAVPLSAYGLVVGFGTAALFAPTLGVSSSNDFLETARLYIKNKDVFAYFWKLIFVNPSIAVLVGCAFARDSSQQQRYAAAHAVTATFICGVIANWIVTYILFNPL
jgi:phospholipid/cholesterol/gamma-HCH transport system permease protein